MGLALGTLLINTSFNFFPDNLLVDITNLLTISVTFFADARLNLQNRVYMQSRLEVRKDRAEKRPDPAFGRWTHQPSLVITVRKDKDNYDLKVFQVFGR